MRELDKYLFNTVLPVVMDFVAIAFFTFIGILALWASGAIIYLTAKWLRSKVK